GDDVEIAGALAVAEEGAFDAVRAGEQPEFSRGDAGAAIIVCVQANDERTAILNVPADPFDLVGIDVAHGYFDGVGKIENHPPLRSGFPDAHDGFGNVLGELDFGGAKALGRILEHDFRALEPRQAVLDHLRPTHRQVNDLLRRHAEDDAALRRRGGIVKVDNDFSRAGERLEGALDEVLARLDQHLEPDIIGRAVLLDEPAVEGELGVRSGGAAYL